MHKFENGIGVIKLDELGKEMEIILKPDKDIDRLYGTYDVGPFKVRLFPDGAHIIPQNMLK